MKAAILKEALAITERALFLESCISKVVAGKRLSMTLLAGTGENLGEGFQAQLVLTEDDALVIQGILGRASNVAGEAAIKLGVEF